jgi:hypothetical protein
LPKRDYAGVALPLQGISSRDYTSFDRQDQRPSLFFRLQALVWTQILRQIGPDVAQLLLARLLESLALAELLRFELATADQVPWRDVQQLLRLVQLLGERLGLLLAAHQVALDGLILTVRRQGE